VLEEIFDDPGLADFWYAIFEAVRSGGIDTWDYQLVYASLINSWLNVIPAVNLVTNIGFGPDATHTKSPTGFDNQPPGDLRYPLQHPDFAIRCQTADEITEREEYGVARAKDKSPGPQSASRARPTARAFSRRQLARAISRIRMFAPSRKGG